MAADTREDTVPPAADDLTPVTPTLDPRRTPPEIDVPALAALLDGRYADVRALVRRNLATYASVLEEAETLTRDGTATGCATSSSSWRPPSDGDGLPAGVRRRRRHRRVRGAFETLAFGDCLLVKVGVQFGLFGGAILQLGTKPHHDAYLRDLVTGQPLVDAFGVPPEMLRSPDLLG